MWPASFVVKTGYPVTVSWCLETQANHQGIFLKNEGSHHLPFSNWNLSRGKYMYPFEQKVQKERGQYEATAADADLVGTLPF